MKLWSSSFAELLLSLYMSRHRAACVYVCVCVCVCVLRNDIFFFALSIYLPRSFFSFLYPYFYTCVLILYSNSPQLSIYWFHLPKIQVVCCFCQDTLSICAQGKEESRISSAVWGYLTSFVPQTYYGDFQKTNKTFKKKNLWTSFFRTSFSMSCTSLSLNAPPPAPPRGVMMTGSKNSRTGETLQSEL